MAKLHGENFTKSALYKRSVNIGQIASIDEVELKDGRARNIRVYRVRSGNGLAFDLLPGKCMDISSLSYKGVNISLLTRNGLSSPENMFPANGEFERYFSGGMLWTCGLKNCGPNYWDDHQQFHHYHGRLATLPSEQSWKKSYFEGDEYYLTAGAVLRDTTIEGHNLEFTRELRTSLSTPEIAITDSIENLDCNETDYLLLYHFNFGFPFVDENLKLLFPQTAKLVGTGNTHSNEKKDEWAKISPPDDNVSEYLFFHAIEPETDGTATIRLENPKIGIGSYLRYETEYLPYIVQWKCNRSYEYALGIEPSNNLIGGMQAEREAGHSKVIRPGEKHNIKVVLGFYDL
jgi:hypothetical protein